MFSKKAPPPSAKQQLKGVEKDLKGENRQLDRELRSMAQTEAKLTADIKAAAKRGEDSTVRILAKQLIKLRGQRERILKTKGTITGVQYQARGAQSQVALAGAMQKGAAAMSAVNAMIDPASMQRTAAAMQRSAAMAEMQDEMIDEMFDDAEMSDEADDLLAGVFDEIGLQIDGALPSTSSLAPVPAAKSKEREVSDEEVNALLAGL